MPGVANTTIGPGLSMYERSNGCTTTIHSKYTHNVLLKHHTNKIRRRQAERFAGKKPALSRANSGTLYLSLKLKSKTESLVKDLINAKNKVTVRFGLKLKSKTKLTAKKKYKTKI